MQVLPVHQRSPSSQSSPSQLRKPTSPSPTRSISCAVPTNTSEPDRHGQQYLPTPTSLPDHHLRISSASENLAPTRSRSATPTLLQATLEADQMEQGGGGSSEAKESDVRSESEPRHASEPLGGDSGLPFEFDMDLDVEDIETMELERGEGQEQTRFPTTSGSTTASPFASSHRPRRVSRARYASSESEISSPPPDRLPSVKPDLRPADWVIPSHKRTFSHVSTSTGLTPPALQTPAFESAPVLIASPPASPRLASISSTPHCPSLEVPLPSSSLSIEIAQHPLFSSAPLDPALRPLPGYTRARTHSFESQRASAVRASGRRNLLEVSRESGESSRSSSLRRRSPVPRNDPGATNARHGDTGVDRERGGSKRRRASTLLPGDDDFETLSETAHQGTQAFAPALGARFSSQAQTVEPVLSRAPTAPTNEGIDDDESFQFRSRQRVGFGLGRGGGLSLSRPSIGSLRQQQGSTSPGVPSSEAEERRTTSRHSFSRLPPWWRSHSFSQSASDRPSPPSLSESLAVGTSTSFLPTPPLPPLLASDSITSATSDGTSSSLLRPRLASANSLSSFTRDESRHVERSDRLNRRGDEILREAEETLRFREAVLRDAEETTRRAQRLLSEDREDRERERRINRLPDVGRLPEPSELAARPVIGLRLGEGWPTTTNPSVDSTSAVTRARSPPPLSPPAFRRRRSSLFSSLSPPSSPDEEGLATTGTSSRTRQFLTSLRSRRPRFSRNSTGTTPPELASPPLGDMLHGSSYDIDAEQRAATELNERLLERRRISASLEPPTLEGGRREAGTSDEPRVRSGLWGETLVWTSRSRMRGPTEGQNERWRRGQAPSLAAGSTTPALVTTSSGLSTPVNGPESRHTITGPLEIQNNATDSNAISYFSRRDDSPSPQRTTPRTRGFRRPTVLADGDTLDDALTEQISRTSSSNGARPSIRLPLNATAQSGPSSSRTRLRFDMEDDEPVHDDGGDSGRPRWNPPQLPLMLPSGSDGRRMVFPHPANAAGMSDSLEAAEEGGTATSRRSERERRWFDPFGPEHLERSSFNPFDDLPPASSSVEAQTEHRADSTANSRIAPSSAPTLAGTLSLNGSRRLLDNSSLGGPTPSSSDAGPTLRRRHYGSLSSTVDDAPLPALEDARDSVDAVAERLAQHRVERLASLRRERTFMRGLLGGGAGGGSSGGGEEGGVERSTWRERARDSLDLERERRSSAAGVGASSPPRSPGFRRRGLGEFFRGFGGGARLISIFDEEYGAFFGRDAVALDSRNYLEDDEFDASYEGLLRLSAQIGDVKPKGVSQEALSRLRTFPYSKWPYIEHTLPPPKDSPPVASTSANKLEEGKPEFARKGSEKEERCAICLCDYEEEDEIALAQCSHGFHSECLRAWLKDHGSCPVCRRDHTG